MADEDEDQAAFDDEEDTDMDDDTDVDDEDEEDDGQAGPPAPPATAAADLNAAAVSQTPNPNPLPAPALAPAPQNGAIQVVGDVTTPTPDLKRPRIEERRPQPSASFDDSRRLFQRLWTDEDEIKILRGFLEFTSSRGTTFASHQYDTGPFYEQIKNELQLDFNKNQLIEKLRRLKKKYRNTSNRMANHGKEFTFKSPHEKATYEIARKIWSASIKRSRESDDDDLNPYSNNTSEVVTSSDRKTSRSRRRSRKRALDTLPATPVVPALPPPPAPVLPVVTSSEGVFKVEVQTAPITTPLIIPTTQKPSNSPAPLIISSVMEETVKSCFSPIFKELLNSAVSAPLGLGVNLPPLLNFGGNLGNSSSSDERWKKQQIHELEVYLKRVELIRDLVKSTLEELKASQP